EQMLLAHMMNSMEVAEKVRIELGGHFSKDEFHALAAYLYGFYEEGNPPDAGAFIHRLPDKKLMQTASEIAMIPIDEDVSEQELADYIHQVKNYPIWLEIEELEKERQVAEKGQNPEEAARIAMKILEKKREIRKS
ncbi:MAG TPA: DNA primase, partial [Bacillales bacterium]|nr:DNA primase [Bacillales bacterium]